MTSLPYLGAARQEMQPRTAHLLADLLLYERARSAKRLAVCVSSNSICLQRRSCQQMQATYNQESGNLDLKTKLSVSFVHDGDPIYPQLPEVVDRFMVEPVGLSVDLVARFLGVTGLVAVAGVAGAVGLAGMEPIAFIEHVRLQYGWTLAPSLYFGLCLQCYENRIR